MERVREPWHYDPFDTRLSRPNYIHSLCVDSDVDSLSGILYGDHTGVNSRDNKDLTPLHLAVISADQPALSDLLMLLIQSGAQLNAKEHNGGNTALHYAILYAKEDSAELASAILLKKGALPAPVNKVGRTPFDYALANGYRKLAQLIADVEENPEFLNDFDPFKWKGINEYTPETLGHHISEGDTKGAGRVLRQLPKERMNDYKPLHEAVSKAPSKEEMVVALLSSGANPSEKDQNGDTAIGVAIKTLPHNREMLSVIQRLLNGGVPTQSQNKDGLDAVSLARDRGYKDVVELLTTGKMPKQQQEQIPSSRPVPSKTVQFAGNTNTNPNEFSGEYHELHEILNQRGKSAAVMATELEALFRANPGLDPNLRTQDAYKDTPLHMAVRREKIQCVDYLIGQGAKISVKNTLGETPLLLSRKGIYGGNREIEDMLTKANRVQLTQERWKKQQRFAQAVNAFSE